MADTVVYQSRQKLKETQGQILQQCGHRYFENVTYCKGMKFVSLECRSE